MRLRLRVIGDGSGRRVQSFVSRRLDDHAQLAEAVRRMWIRAECLPPSELWLERPDGSTQRLAEGAPLPAW